MTLLMNFVVAYWASLSDDMMDNTLSRPDDDDDDEEPVAAARSEGVRVDVEGRAVELRAEEEEDEEEEDEEEEADCVFCETTIVLEEGSTCCAP